MESCPRCQCLYVYHHQFVLFSNETDLNLFRLLFVILRPAQDQFDSVTGEFDGFCATATYGLNANGTISVLNKDRFGSITGKVVAVNGWCYQADPTQPGQLTLYFPGVAPGPAPYWIVQRTYTSPHSPIYGLDSLADGVILAFS